MTLVHVLLPGMVELLFGTDAAPPAKVAKLGIRPLHSGDPRVAASGTPGSRLTSRGSQSCYYYANDYLPALHQKFTDAT